MLPVDGVFVKLLYQYIYRYDVQGARAKVMALYGKYGAPSNAKNPGIKIPI